MKKLTFCFTILISGILCLWTDWALGYTFPEKPTARFGKGSVEHVVYSPDGKLLAVAGNLGVWLYNAKDLTEVGLLQDGNTSGAPSIAFSPDGKLLAAGGWDSVVRLWDVQGQKRVAALKGHEGWVRGHKSWVEAVAFSPDGKLIASGGSDNAVRLWDVQGQKQVAMLKGHTGGVNSIAFNPDGKLLVSAGREEFPTFVDSTIRLWDLQWRNQAVILQKHKGDVTSVVFSPDGRFIAWAGQDAKVYLWNVQKQKLMATLMGHKDWVHSIAISRDGKWLASGGIDGIILLWKVDLYTVQPEGKQPITLSRLKRTMLLQNFPNPFNPETWIPFKLAEDAQVTIQVYDAQGQLVRELELGQKPAGEYFTKETAAYWDGRNELGESVANGLYFYRLNAGKFTVTRRMFAVK